VAPQRDETFKQKGNYCVRHTILQKFTNFHAIRSWSFQNICNKTRWPRFFGPSCIYCIFDIQLQPFILSEMTFSRHSRLSAMSSFIRSPGLSTRDRKSRLHCFSDKNSWNNLEDRSRSLYNHSALAGFRLPSATVVSAEPFSHGTGTLRCLQKEMATYRYWSVSLWRDPDRCSTLSNLSPDKT